MAKIGFIGLGNMGLPMVKNLIGAGHEVAGFDLMKIAVKEFSDSGGKGMNAAADCLIDAEVIITMLPTKRLMKA